jgi:hypothetical protein
MRVSLPSPRKDLGIFDWRGGTEGGGKNKNHFSNLFFLDNHILDIMLCQSVWQKSLKLLCSTSSFLDFHGLPAAFKGPLAALCDNELIAAFLANIPFADFIRHVVLSSLHNSLLFDAFFALKIDVFAINPRIVMPDLIPDRLGIYDRHPEYLESRPGAFAST